MAEIVAALSLATDLGYGQPMEHVLRSSVIALRLSATLGLDDAERASVYYVGLLACVGCFADAHEQARWFGDDIALKADMYDVDFAGWPMMGVHAGARRQRAAAARPRPSAGHVHGRRAARGGRDVRDPLPGGRHAGRAPGS
jgi:hypothetical protein